MRSSFTLKVVIVNRAAVRIADYHNAFKGLTPIINADELRPPHEGGQYPNPRL